MPYDKDSEGESIWLTKAELKQKKWQIKQDELIEMYGPCEEGYQQCKDGKCRKFSKEFKDGTFKPGKSGNPGGKPKGTKNRRTLRRILADQGGLSPAELMYSIMNDESVNLNQRMAAAKELLAFTEQKLTSMEIHTDQDSDSPFTVIVQAPTDTKGTDSTTNTKSTDSTTNPKDPSKDT